MTFYLMEIEDMDRSPKKDACVGNADWDSLTYAEKNRTLFLRQKRMLDLFLERGAISKEQHDKSLHDLIEKMNLVDNPIELSGIE